MHLPFISLGAILFHFGNELIVLEGDCYKVSLLIQAQNHFFFLSFESFDLLLFVICCLQMFHFRFRTLLLLVQLVTLMKSFCKIIIIELH